MNLPREQRVPEIRNCLEVAFGPAQIEVRDDSDRHRGHEGARDGRGHFFVRVVSGRFVALPLLARHRAVYATLGALLHTDIHALSLETLTPDEAASR